LLRLENAAIINDTGAITEDWMGDTKEEVTTYFLDKIGSYFLLP
jgi:hypothetical protein